MAQENQNRAETLLNFCVATVNTEITGGLT